MAMRKVFPVNFPNRGRESISFEVCKYCTDPEGVGKDLRKHLKENQIKICSLQFIQSRPCFEVLNGV